MRKISYTTFALFVSIFSNAQNIQGVATYESKEVRNFSNIKVTSSGTNDPELERRLSERLKKAGEKTFVLTFDSQSSTFDQEQKLEATNTKMNMFSSSSQSFYKDLKSKTLIKREDFFNEEYIVKDSIPTYAWQLGSETKKIGDYTVYKATVVIAEDQTIEKALAAKKAEDNTDTKLAAESKTSFFDSMEGKKERTVTAWYAPEIPVSHGPMEYWGLPGLILELHDGSTSIMCSKIVLSTSNKAKIKPPKGKTMSALDFENYKVKKLKQFMDNRPSGDKGNTISITIGK